MNKPVLLLNGAPGVGKDEFWKIAQRVMESGSLRVMRMTGLLDKILPITLNLDHYVYTNARNDPALKDRDDTPGFMGKSPRQWLLDYKRVMNEVDPDAHARYFVEGVKAGDHSSAVSLVICPDLGYPEEEQYVTRVLGRRVRVVQITRPGYEWGRHGDTRVATPSSNGQLHVIENDRDKEVYGLKVRKLLVELGVLDGTTAFPEYR